jgi:hypothetical protein
MPPLKGIDRGLTGEALKALEESGHGRRLAIVDASYNIPRWAQTVDYRRETSSQALMGILRLVPVEGDHIDLMSPDPDDDKPTSHEAYIRLSSCIEHLFDGHKQGNVHRLDEQENAGEKGFYSLANNQEEDTLFFRTSDKLPYACATFIIGHSQTG